MKPKLIFIINTVMHITQSSFHLMAGGEWDRSCEVFSFGIVLLELITKRVSVIGKREHASINLDSVVHIWAKKEYKSNCSLVHKTLQED